MKKSITSIVHELRRHAEGCCFPNLVYDAADALERSQEAAELLWQGAREAESGDSEELVMAATDALEFLGGKPLPEETLFDCEFEEWWEKDS